MAAMEREQSALDARRAEVERAIGMPIVIRGIRTPDAGLRGRVTARPGYLLLEFQVAAAGYFWHVPIIEELLTRIERGEREIVLRESSERS
jgi:hypothetical protein